MKCVSRLCLNNVTSVAAVHCNECLLILEERCPKCELPMTSQHICPSDQGYQILRDVLDCAYDQAVTGKGEERHGLGRKFPDQHIVSYPRERGTMEGLMFQVKKKMEEAVDLFKNGDAGKAEEDLLGAIVYLAAMVIFIEERD